MNSMRLLKLLYIADRESLRETGRPITGGPVIAMERGPVLKEVYDLILGQHREMPLWAQFFRKERLRFARTRRSRTSDSYPGTRSANSRKSPRPIKTMTSGRLSTSLIRSPSGSRTTRGSLRSRFLLSNILEALGQADAIEELSREAHSLAAFDRLLGK